MENQKRKFKITFNSEDKEILKFIDDYKFFEYFTKVLISDWKDFILKYENLDDLKNKINIVIKHLNSEEWKRYKSIYIRMKEYYNPKSIGTMKIENDILIIDEVCRKHKEFRRWFINYFSNHKNIKLERV